MTIIKPIGIEGKHIDIVPITYGFNITEVYSKEKHDYLCTIFYDKRWKCYVLAELDKNTQMSKNDLIEAFELTEKYWEK